MKHGGEVSEALRAASGKVVGRHFFVTRTQLWFALPDSSECEECGKGRPYHEDHCLVRFSNPQERRAVEIVRALNDKLSPRERMLIIDAFVALLDPRSTLHFTEACQWSW